MKVDFKRLTWENYPSTETPINADNLNRLEEGVAGLYSDMRDIEEELEGGVGEYVTDWLNEHVDPVGSAVVVDNTLSITGAAADAKKTGDEISDLKDDFYDSLVTDTASGAIASFSDGADNVPVKSLTVNIEPVQEGSGDPSPENVRPISGHTQAVVTRCGKNLIHLSEENEVYKNGGASFTLTYADDNTVTMATSTFGALYVIWTTGIKVTESMVGTSVVINSSCDNKCRTMLSGKDGTWSHSKEGSYTYYTFEADDVGRTLGYRLYNDTSGNITISNIQIEVGSTATAYEPYQGQTVTIDLNGTIYGGTLDVTTGGLTVDRAIVDMGTLQWNAFTSSSGFTLLYAPISGLVAHHGAKGACSTYKMLVGNYTWNDLGDKQCILYVGANEARIGVRDSSYTDATAFASAVSGQTVVYELAEPFEVTLTAQEVRTLLGTNNIWSDAGNTEVTYRADTKLYIEKLTAPTEDDMVADANIVSGQYFMVGNTLYKATANIASGGAIMPNVNCTRKSLPEALNEINA